jgi:hypothetical protein
MRRGVRGNRGALLWESVGGGNRLAIRAGPDTARRQRRPASRRASRGSAPPPDGANRIVPAPKRPPVGIIFPASGVSARFTGTLSGGGAVNSPGKGGPLPGAAKKQPYNAPPASSSAPVKGPRAIKAGCPRRIRPAAAPAKRARGVSSRLSVPLSGGGADNASNNGEKGGGLYRNRPYGVKPARFFAPVTGLPALEPEQPVYGGDKPPRPARARE